MKRFDIQNIKKILDSEIGYKLSLNDSYVDAKKAKGLASSASADVTIAVNCLLVGYEEQAFKVAQKAYSWLKEAIDNKEHPNYYFADGTEAMRYENMAILNWLLTKKQDVVSFCEFAKYKDRYLQNEKVWSDKCSINLTLPSYLDGGYYERSLEIYHETPSLKPPKDLRRIKSEANMVYVLSRHYLGQEYTAEQVQSALRTFLNRNVNEWLVRGHSVRAARWMKIAYWNPAPEKMSPRETILKCYNHLPHIEHPF